jgi:hypothetical protein
MSYFDSITLEKGMYHNGLTATLETLDPSANYKDTELASLDAYERQLKRFDIKVSGDYSDIVDKFFVNSNSSVLFPEYVKRAVEQGLFEKNKLSDIVATFTKIDGIDYRTITSDQMQEFGEVKEGESMPCTNIKTQTNLVKLKKRGRMLFASYEALKYQRLDLLTVVLKNIGTCIANSQLSDAVDVLVAGDGNQNAAQFLSCSSQVNYPELLKLWSSLLPYELTTMLANAETVQKILALRELKEADTGLNFRAKGKFITPLGANLILTPNLENGRIVGLDKKCALEMIQAGDLAVDSDKIIDKQLAGTSISATTGFAKIFADATKILETQ